MGYDWGMVQEIRNNPYIDFKDGVLKNFRNLGLGIGIGYLSSKASGVSTGFQIGVAMMGVGTSIVGRGEYNKLKYNIPPTSALMKGAESDMATAIGAATGFALGKLEEIVVPAIQQFSN